MAERTVVDSIEDPGDQRPFDQIAFELALASRPRISASCAWRTQDGATLLWGEHNSPFVLGPLSSAAWPYLDGSVRLDELADDLASAADADEDLARRHLAHLVVRLAAWGLLDEVRGRPALAEDEVPLRRVGFRREEVDGEWFETTEVEVPVAALERVARGVMSLGEVVPAESCQGKRLYLDHPAEVVSLAVGASPLAVRTADPELAAWLRSLPAAGNDSAPVEVFVAGGDPAFGGGRHRRLYDPAGRLLAVTDDPASLRLAVAGALLGRTAPPVEGPAVSARVLLRGHVGVLCGPGLLELNLGLARQLGAAGCEVVPSTAVAIDDRAIVAVDPAGVLGQLERGPVDPASPSCWRRLDPAALVVNAVVEDLVPVELLAALLRSTDAATVDDRRFLLDGTSDLVDRLPALVLRNGDRDLRGLVERIGALLDDTVST